MIYFDVTKARSAGHRSGLIRVSERLGLELGAKATPVVWRDWDREMKADDWFLTAELFSEEERPGWTDFVRARRGRIAAIFHDAIPLKFPHTTWPKSVARHPGYMKMLAEFDLVWAVSQASREELRGYWHWLGLALAPQVEVLSWGADFNGKARVAARGKTEALFLCVGILEPRKNQALLLDAAETLWRAGQSFELHLVGRVNPHFGGPVVERIRALRKQGRAVFHHEGLDDAGLARLYARARCTLLPTQAEGCGLPLLESLWLGAPCLCSDLPVLAENAHEGGCLPVALNDVPAWAAAMGQMLDDEALQARLNREAVTRPLPEWKTAARTIERALAVSASS